MATMDRALATLEELGALSKEGALTALGRNMVRVCAVSLRRRLTILGHSSRRCAPCEGEMVQPYTHIPADLPQMLILAALFRCLGPVLTIAAVLSSKPIFLSPPDQRNEADE